MAPGTDRGLWERRSELKTMKIYSGICVAVVALAACDDTASDGSGGGRPSNVGSDLGHLDASMLDTGSPGDAGSSDSGTSNTQLCPTLCDGSMIPECTSVETARCFSDCEMAVDGLSSDCAACLLGESMPLSRLCLGAMNCFCAGAIFPPPESPLCSSSCP